MTFELYEHRPKNAPSLGFTQKPETNALSILRGTSQRLKGEIILCSHTSPITGYAVGSHPVHEDLYITKAIGPKSSLHTSRVLQQESKSVIISRTPRMRAKHLFAIEQNYARPITYYDQQFTVGTKGALALSTHQGILTGFTEKEDALKYIQVLEQGYFSSQNYTQELFDHIESADFEKKYLDLVATVEHEINRYKSVHAHK